MNLKESVDQAKRELGENADSLKLLARAQELAEGSAPRGHHHPGRRAAMEQALAVGIDWRAILPADVVRSIDRYVEIEKDPKATIERVNLVGFIGERLVGLGRR